MHIFLIDGRRNRKIGSVLFLDALNPTHIPFSSAHGQTLGIFYQLQNRMSGHRNPPMIHRFPPGGVGGQSVTSDVKAYTGQTQT